MFYAFFNAFKQILCHITFSIEIKKEREGEGGDRDFNFQSLNFLRY